MDIEFQYNGSEYTVTADIDLKVEAWRQYEEVGCGSYLRKYEEKEILNVSPIYLYKEGEQVSFDAMPKAEFNNMLEVVSAYALEEISSEDFCLL